MVYAEIADLALKVAKGLFKVGQRVDLVLAEKAAVEAQLPLLHPNLVLPPPQEVMYPALVKLLEETAAQAEGEAFLPDPLRDDREDIARLVEAYEHGDDPDLGIMLGYMKKYLPEQALGRTLDLNSRFLEQLHAARPDWDLADPDIRAAAFFVCQGEGREDLEYVRRIATIVVDVFSQVGADSASLFTKDEKVGGIVKGVLQRFADADLDTAGSWGAVLHKTLSATLDGVLLVRDEVEIDNAWFDGILDAVVSARESVEDEGGDFVLSLFRGRGYARLVGALLDRAGTELSDRNTGLFGDIAGDVLARVAHEFDTDGDLKDFVVARWGDILQAGLGAVAQHGDELVGDGSPLARKVVTGVLDVLAETPLHRALTTDTLTSLIDVAVEAAATSPELLGDEAGDEWLGVLVRSVLRTMQSEGSRKVFSVAGLETLTRDALSALAEHPELLVAKPGLPQELVRDVLETVAGAELDRSGAEQLASVALARALETLGERPDLLDFGYSGVVETICGQVAGLLKERRLTRIQASDLVDVAIASLAEYPPVLAKLDEPLPKLVVQVVTSLAEGEGGELLRGDTLTRVADVTLTTLMRMGRDKLDELGAGELVTELEAVLSGGLEAAAGKLGRQLGLGNLPGVMGEVVAAWARGELSGTDAKGEVMVALIDELTGRASA